MDEGLKAFFKEWIKFKLSEKYAVTVVQYRSRAIFIRRIAREQSENNRSWCYAIYSDGECAV